MEITLTDMEFSRFQRFIHGFSGIHLSDAKKALVSSRLTGRLCARSLSNFGEYYRLINNADEAEEMQTAVDLLTTNETYFFREPKYVEFLRKVLAARARGGPAFRVWSAASSSGKEA